MDNRGNLSPQRSALHENELHYGVVDAPYDLVRDDKFESVTPEIRVQLLTGRFLIYVAGFSVFFIGFAITFFKGIMWRDDVLDEIGSSDVSEDLVTKVNAASGFIMELFQVAVWMGVDKFYPVYEVYFHNLFFPQGTDENDENGEPVKNKSASYRWRRVAVWALPFLIMLAIQNSFKSFQASQKTVGFMAVMSASDMKYVDPRVTVKKTKNSSTTTPVVAMARKFEEGSVRRTLLKNAIEQKTTPFYYDIKSNCTQKKSKNASDDHGSLSSSIINVDGIDSTSVVYGFISNEWNDEALPVEQTPVHKFNVSATNVRSTPAPDWLNMSLQFDLFLHAKASIERAISDASFGKYPCELSDSPNYNDTTLRSVQRRARQARANVTRRLQQSGDEDSDFLLNFDDESSSGSDSETADVQSDDGMCFGAISTLTNFGSDYKDSSRRTLPVLMEHTVQGIEQSLISFSSHQYFDFNLTTDTMLNKDETKIIFEQYQLNPRIRVDAMRLDVVLHDEFLLNKMSECQSEVPAGVQCNSSVMTYDIFTNDLCGAEGCIFMDEGAIALNLRKQVTIMPFMAQCNPSNATYNKHHRMYSMNSCKPVENSALVFGLGSYISAEEIGSEWRGVQQAYFVSPRRHYRFTVARLSWEPEQLDKVFGVECKTDDCTGLAYKLEGSGRFLFAGKEALRMNRLEHARLERPVSLVRLNPAQIELKSGEDTVGGEIERINPKYVTSNKWKPLKGSNCSRLADSYLKQVENNAYYLERPLQVMYTAGLFFLFESASAASFKNSTAGADKSTIDLSLQSGKKAIENLKFAGDIQVRKLRLKMPDANRYAAIAGSCLIVLFMLFTVGIPSDPLRSWERESHVTEYLAMQDDDAYSERVHSTTFRNLPDETQTNEMGEYRVTEITLRQANGEDDRRIYM